jgi:hypothetical protein
LFNHGDCPARTDHVTEKVVSAATAGATSSIDFKFYPHLSQQGLLVMQFHKGFVMSGRVAEPSPKVAAIRRGGRDVAKMGANEQPTEIFVS